MKFIPIEYLIYGILLIERGNKELWDLNEY